MDAKLFSSYRYLVQVIHPHDKPTADRLFYVVEELEALYRSSGARPSGLFVAFYTCLEQACREGDLTRAAEISQLLMQAGRSLRAVADLSQSSTLLESYSSILDSALTSGALWKPSPDAVTLAVSQDVDRRRSEDALRVALGRIDSLVPEYFRELQECVTNIFVIRTDCMNAGSSFLTYGVIFLKELQEGQDWSAYFEHVIHESAHHALFAIMACHRLFLEGQSDGKYASPFRSEPRPLDAIYHAAFVLSRLCDALEVAGLGAFIRTYARTARYNHENPKPIPAQFYDAYGVLMEHARLTRDGRELLESARAVVDQYL